MDIRVALAREQHRAAASLDNQAGGCRAMRDKLIRELHAEGYSYGQLAKHIGVSKELVAYICRGENKTGPLAP